MVRRQSGRGSQLLYFYFQELENPERCALRRSGTGTERNRDGGDVPTRRARIHGAERWSAVHIFAGHIVLCKLRDAGRKRRVLGERLPGGRKNAMGMAESASR